MSLTSVSPFLFIPCSKLPMPDQHGGTVRTRASTYSGCPTSPGSPPCPTTVLHVLLHFPSQFLNRAHAYLLFISYSANTLNYLLFSNTLRSLLSQYFTHAVSSSCNAFLLSRLKLTSLARWVLEILGEHLVKYMIV